MAVALEDFCGSDFWDLQTVWNTTSPDLPICFQKTVLVWIPCAFIWLFAPWLIAVTLKSRIQKTPWSGRNISQLGIIVLIILLLILEMSQSVHLYLNNYEVPSVEFYSPLVGCVTMILVASLMYAEKRKGLPTSGVIFIFWLLQLLAGLVTYRTYILYAFDEHKSQDKFIFILYMIRYPLIVAELVLCCFSDVISSGKLVEGEKKPSPEINSSFLSRMLFLWFDRIILTGFRRTLVYDDIWALNEEFSCRRVASQFHRHWKSQLKKAYRSDSLVQQMEPVKVFDQLNKAKKKKPLFFIALCKSFGLDFLVTVFLEIVNVSLTFVNPIFLEMMIKFTENDEPVWRGYFYGAIIVVTTILQSLVDMQYDHYAYRVAVKVRSALISAVYRKALRLSNSARRSATVGEIVNLMSVDVQNFIPVIIELNALWSAPVLIGIALYMLWGHLGPAVLAGLAVLIVLVPVNSYMMSRIDSLLDKQMENKDQRVKLMNELLNGIKVLKMYAWECPFANEINKVRSKELALLKTTAYLDGFVEFICRTTPVMILLASFGTYVLIDSRNVLDASKAFVSLSLFNILEYPMIQIPLMLVGVAQARVSLRRLQGFLLNEELNPNNVVTNSIEVSEKNISVVVKKGTFSWGPELEATLRDINLEIPQGHLVAIVGSVGSGKSSLLSAVLGEMEKLEGVVQSQGNYAYTPQQAWILNATIQNNILFGNHFDAQKYNKIVEACELIRDLEILPAGSDTEIGEKGINLSGGQKQRVSLARAVYNDADVYLLDDPLSAVDSQVGKNIFEKVLGPNGLLKDKTRLLVTHGITFLPQVDTIVVLNNKTVSEVGSYRELLEKKGAFAEFLLAYLDEAAEEDEALQEIKDELLTKLGPETDTKRQLCQAVSSRVSSSSEKQHHTSRSFSVQMSRESVNHFKRSISSGDYLQDGQLVTIEEAETGQVNFRIYLFYLKSVGIWLGILTLVLNVLSWTCSIGTNLWLENWSSDPPPLNGTVNAALRDLRLGVYGSLGFLSAFFIFSSTMTLVLNCVQASRFLHNEMLTAILHSPMAFFDTTPVGRILNRFSQDLYVVDTECPEGIHYSITTVLEIVAALVVIAIQTPVFLAALVPISVLYYVIQKFYIRTSRQLKRMESITCSPIYTHFSETLTGIAVIRAYKKQKEFILESDKRVDETQSYYYANQVCTRWVQMRLDLVGSLIVSLAIIFAILNKDNMTSSSVGLSITYALSVISLLNWCVRVLSDTEKNFVAVERIREYVEISYEADWEIIENKPPPNWPEKGCINFDGYKTRYRPGLDLVLHGLTCCIDSCEKIGIVGRTGAGKSSLALALFRIIEAAEGRILIDGIDISKIGLHDLRKNLTIIPQEPVLFCGTLRNNLDPFNSYTDEELWTALKLSHLYSFVKSLPEALYHEIAEGGENLSVGQCQLVCLGRAVLRKTKVLVLDEATAAVDLETDELIQLTIKKEFAECTILTVAHRLNTVMDSDRVMVLDQGLIKEFDTPSALLQDINSTFYSMAKDAGLV